MRVPRRSLLLVGIPAALVVGPAISRFAESRAHGAGALPFVLLGLVGLVVTFGLPILCLVLVLRSRKPSSGPSSQHGNKDLVVQKWNAAALIGQFLVVGRSPNPIQVWDIVPQPGETFWLDGEATYSRLYSQTVSYRPSRGFVVGRSSAVLAGLALSAFSNASARRKASAAAAEQWRERQPCRVLVSNHRVVCRANNQWLSFWYGDITSVNPQPDQWALFFDFGSTQPLSLDGLDVPAIAALVVASLYGPAALEEHPGFARLRAAI